MQKRFTLIGFLFLACFTNLTIGQNLQISGTVLDEEDAPMPYATVVIMQAEDSVIAQFGITNNDGQFKITGVKPGNYITQITFMGYESFSQPLGLSADHDWGQIKMEKSFGLPELENQTLLKGVEELILILQEQVNIKK